MRVIVSESDSVFTFTRVWCGVVWCGQVVVSVLFVQEVVGLVLPSRCLQRPYLCHTGSCLSWVGLLVAGLVVSLLLNFASGLLLYTFMCDVV